MRVIKAIRGYRLVSLKIAGFHFNPGLVSSLVTCALLYTMISLGFWQTGRAEFKDTLQQNISARKKISPAGLDTLPASSDQRRYLPVKFFAEYDGKHSFLLDNITFNGQVGYHVYTPAITSDGMAILVNRGFIQQGATRDQLPEISAPDSTIVIAGLLDLPPSRPMLLAENVQETSRWPVVLQYIDIDEISSLLGYQVYDMVLWLNPDMTGAFEYDLPVLNLNAAKNIGYAFQWFAMSAALFIIYIVVNTKRMV